ncbi:hypothetical protein WME99_14045 [Sorangium sp. So ce136]|uniref:hypothetical protein n=1 Tax=Sorangium sp. So ce136 TaxID=3133284 RepID=UPI003F0DF73D
MKLVRLSLCESERGQMRGELARGSPREPVSGSAIGKLVALKLKVAAATLREGGRGLDGATLTAR